MTTKLNLSLSLSSCQTLPRHTSLSPNSIDKFQKNYDVKRSTTKMVKISIGKIPVDPTLSKIQISFLTVFEKS